MGLFLIITKSRVPSYQDCLTQSQTGVGAALCVVMGIEALIRLKPEVPPQADNSEVEALLKKLATAEGHIAAAQAREDRRQASMERLLESTNALLEEIQNLPERDKPIGPEFLRLYNRGTCGGGGAENYCGEEGAVFQPSATSAHPSTGDGHP